MCINLNPSICDFLPSRCGVCNSCGCVCFCVTVKRRGGKQGGNKHLEYIQDTVRLTPPTLKYVCYICTDWWFSSEKTEHNVSNTLLYVLTCMWFLQFANLFRIEKKKIVPLVFSNCLSDLNKWSVNEMVCHGVVCNGVGDWTWYSKLIKCCRLVWAESFPLHC